MCGIIGTVGTAHASKAIIKGLKRLEYRGYDSAGIAIIDGGVIRQARAKGKIVNLEEKLAADDLLGYTGIGHTRWATHGEPSERNAHPHRSTDVTVVHNGIIENYQSLREELASEGAEFSSQTDTEVIPHLISQQLQKGLSPEEAVRATLERLEGAYAIAILFAGKDNFMIAARHGSPLAVGYGKQANFVGSDAFALSPFCDKLGYLEDGDMAVITPTTVAITDHCGKNVSRETHSINQETEESEKGEFSHYMLKEIFEQPSAIADTLAAFDEHNPLKSLPFSLSEVSKITMIACGTSYYAAMVASYWFEQIAGIPCSVEIASEFRYRKPLLPTGGMAVFISQSGETADTLAALRHCKAEGQHTLALVNAVQSSMEMEADATLFTKAGVEIGVASTKAFTTQLVALAVLALRAAEMRNALEGQALQDAMTALHSLPQMAEAILELDKHSIAIASSIMSAHSMLYIGRGTSYPIACEGALKMKEISYIHAEGYAAGELKHGPIALIDHDTPIVVVAPNDDLFEKTASNLEEVAARGGRVILLSTARGVEKMQDKVAHSIALPDMPELIAPMLYTIALQLLSYHTAVLKGTDVDQPRNLAKSVTVE